MSYRLYTGDCLELMAQMPDNSVDLLFTDLPYGTTQCKWDTPIDLARFWEEAGRVVRSGGAKVLFAQTPFDKVLGTSNLRELRYEWIWEKTQPTGHLNAKRMPMKAHENLLVFYDKLPIYHPQMTEGHKPGNSFRHVNHSQNKGGIYGKMDREYSGGGSTVRYPRSVLCGPTDKQTCYLHPTQKPVWLCRYIVETYTDPGMVVLDCCMGSASIGVACIQSGREYIGMDLDPKWVQVSENRLAALEAVG